MGYRRVNDLRTGRGEDRLGGPAVRMIFSKRAARCAIRELCNRAAETIKLDPAADRCGRRRGLKWWRVSFSTVPPMLAPPRSQGAYALSSAKTVCRGICAAEIDFHYVVSAFRLFSFVANCRCDLFVATSHS